MIYLLLLNRTINMYILYQAVYSAVSNIRLFYSTVSDYKVVL